MTDNEKAHAPTGDEREERSMVRRAVGGVLFHVTNFPERAQSHLLGENMGPLNEKITDAVLGALRRSEVSEPSSDRVELAAATIAVSELVRTRRTWGDLLDVQKDEYRRVAREVLRATDVLPVPTPDKAGYAEFEGWEQEMFRHQPVLSMADGSIAGCQCLDRVFVKSREDWGTHLASVITARLPEPQGEPSSVQDDSERRAAYRRDHRAELIRQERAALRAR